MTNADDSSSRRLHRRLTVALAAAPERQRVVRAERGRTGVVVVTAADVDAEAQELADARSTDRIALRARMDAASGRALHARDEARTALRELQATQERLRDGAAWALAAGADLPEQHAAVEAALSSLESRQHEQRTARQALERVLEQRAAAMAAMDEADRELAELVGVGMDETGLRRELEASGHAAREIQDRHTEAVTRLQELEAERVELELRSAELRDVVAGRPTPVEAVDAAAVGHVRAALEAYEDDAVTNGLDQRAQNLADAFTDLSADLAEVASRAPVRPDDQALRAADERARAAAEVLARFEEAAKAQGLTAAERAQIDAAHAAVVAAEEAAQRRVGGGGARRRLEQARDAEQAVLASHGFAAYLDVVLGGGKVDTHSPERLEAERTYVRACAERDALRSALEASFGASPELAYLETEQLRLVSHAAEVLDVEARELEALIREDRTQLIRVLRGHPLVSSARRADLRAALAAVDVIARPGESLSELAASWLESHEQDLVLLSTRSDASLDGAETELAALEVRAKQISDELAAARAREELAAGDLQQARRSVGAFEAELSVRAGEDEQRIHRFAAAEQLRHQVEALSATLVRAEHDAREALDRATEATGAAEVSFDRAQAVLTEVARRARRLLAELPKAVRPEGDPLTVLPELASRLDDQARAMEPSVTAASVALEHADQDLHDAMAAADSVGTGREGPRPEDVDDAVLALLSAGADLLVLDDPCSHLRPGTRERFQAQLVERSVAGQVLLLSEDPGILGWAIELPADVAMVLPADSLLNLSPRGADTEEAVTSTEPAPLGRAPLT